MTFKSREETGREFIAALENQDETKQKRVLFETLLDIRDLLIKQNELFDDEEE